MLVTIRSVPDQPLAPILGQLVGMCTEPGCNLSLDRLRQQRSSAWLLVARARKALMSVTAYHSFNGEVEARPPPTIRGLIPLIPSPLWSIALDRVSAHGTLTVTLTVKGDIGSRRSRRSAFVDALAFLAPELHPRRRHGRGDRRTATDCSFFLAVPTSPIYGKRLRFLPISHGSSLESDRHRLPGLLLVIRWFAGFGGRHEFRSRLGSYYGGIAMITLLGVP